MTIRLLLIVLFVVAPILSAQQATYDEPYRPQFHFTPEINWTNDPNGLVYHDGEWHLFYQYNPFGDLWGHMRGDTPLARIFCVGNTLMSRCQKKTAS